jgi:hypothetical protein
LLPEGCLEDLADRLGLFAFFENDFLSAVIFEDATEKTESVSSEAFR